MGIPNYRYLVLILALVILSGTGGYYAGQRTNLNYSPASVNKINAPNPATNTFFDQQKAFLTGTIAAVNGTTITVKNDRGQTSDFPLAKTFVNYQPITNPLNGAPSRDPKTILIGERATIDFELVDAKYRVADITYLYPPPSASPSATPLK